MDAATEVVAVAVGVGPEVALPGFLGLHPARPAPGAIAQVAGQVVVVAAFPSVTPAAVLPVVETRTVPSTALKADATIEAVNAGSIGAAIKASKDVVVDEPRIPVPELTIQATPFPGLLVASANMATGRGRPARSVPGRGAGAASAVGPWMEVATSIPAEEPGRTRPSVRPADALRTRPVVAKALPGLEVAKGAAVATPLVAA